MGSRKYRARTQSSIPSHTLLTGPINGGFGRCFEPPRAGTTSSRGTLGPFIHSTYPYPTYGGVGTASGGLQGARRLAYDPGIIGLYQCGKRVKLELVGAQIRDSAQYSKVKRYCTVTARQSCCYTSCSHVVCSTSRELSLIHI